MKKINIIYIAFFSVLLMACDDYLDIEPKKRKLLETAEEFSALLENDVYFDFPHNDIGYLTGERFVMRESWLTEDQYPVIKANVTFDESADRAKFIETDRLYNNCYKRISNYNIIIENIDESEGDADFKQQVKAQACILRAYNYFFLVNFYAKHYQANSAATDNGIILTYQLDLESVLKQYSVQVVYDAIEQDIDAAIEWLPETPDNTFRPGKAFGYALKAKVHLFKKEFDKALVAADQSLSYNDYIFDMVDYANQTAGNPFAVRVGYEMAENNLFRYGHNFMGLYFSVVSPEFVQNFETGDLRLELFFGYNPNLIEGCMYYKLMTFAFEANPGGLRSVEALLMKAECMARQGEVDAAMDLVNQLRAKRIRPENYVPLTAANTQEAMAVIIDERARELNLTPNRYWDLRRLNTEPEYAVTLTRTYNGQTYTLEPESHLYIHPFSVEALSRNVNLKQNSK
ncbi:RagB/SusD family nutrient uptake outer membrane protein [Carboxylicivirga taeanensis]|uniref:RagB/SusD family nutrient uptake outer membrane protein n=1 Tax=Carboxylicivirga taeanensis TaxID=1416875 RepID=UPI003F6DC6C2